jgi:hypothetical protein
MSLLREIQDAVRSPDCDIGTLLEQCRTLSAQTGHSGFANWVSLELNGYDDPVCLPAYRKIKVNSLGHFSDFSGNSLRNLPVPESVLPHEVQEIVLYCRLTQPIHSYAVLIDRIKRTDAYESWPADLVLHCGHDLYPNLNCTAAWKRISCGEILNMLDAVKFKISQFCLEIERE